MDRQPRLRVAHAADHDRERRRRLDPGSPGTGDRAGRVAPDPAAAGTCVRSQVSGPVAQATIARRLPTTSRCGGSGPRPSATCWPGLCQAATGKDCATPASPSAPAARLTGRGGWRATARRELAELTGASAGCRCGRLCRVLGTHLSGRSAGGRIRLAEPGVSRRRAWAPTPGDLSDAENTCSKRLGSERDLLPSLHAETHAVQLSARNDAQEGRRGLYQTLPASNEAAAHG